MKLRIELFACIQPDGWHTVSVVGRPEMAMHHPALEEIEETLALLVTDEVERTHPRAQASYSAAAADPKLVDVEIDDWLTVYGQEQEEERLALSLSVLVSERRAWRSLHVPRLDLHIWLPRSLSDWIPHAVEAIKDHVEGWSPHLRLLHRKAPTEVLRSLELEVEAPRLSDFAGKYREAMQLPPRWEGRVDHPQNEERSPTPVLDRLGTPVHQRVSEQGLEPAFERTAELARLEAALCGPKQAIALVGSSGVGKTALLDEVARRLCRPRSPEDPRPQREMWFADASRLVSGQGWFGDWQQQTLAVIQELESVNGIWSVGALLALLDAGKNISSDQNVAQLITPALAGRRVMVVAECSSAAWNQLQVRNPSFARFFTPFRVEDPAEEESDRVASRLAEHLSKTQGQSLLIEALAAAKRLCKRYARADVSAFGHRMAFLKRVAARAEAADQPVINEGFVIESFALETGLPSALLRDDIPLDAEEVRHHFETRLLGQPLAVDRLTDLVAVIKTGLSDLSRPLGSFLFIGPTGVGKTEAAKALAEYLFGTSRRMIRFDMSELSAPESIDRFIGGSSGEGRLAQSIRRQPFSVVLLDEVEKAHPAVFDVLLQVLGEARLTDESGRTADFRNAAIIMTSNLGVATLKQAMGFSSKGQLDLSSHFRKEAERFFRPEFFNRIDHVVPFSTLGTEAIRAITDRELEKLVLREGLRQRQLKLQVPPAVRDVLTAVGVDERYGARPLKRAIENMVALPLAEHLAKGSVAPGSTLASEVWQDSASKTPAVKFSVDENAGDSGFGGRGPLSRLLSELSELRFRVQRWMLTPDYRDIASDVRLLDQLGRVRAFWDDRTAAEARMRGVEDKRALVAEWQSFLHHLSALEDLTLEAYYEGNTTDTQELREETLRAGDTIERMEADLFDRRFDHPRRAYIIVEAVRDLNPLTLRLLETYLQLAHARGWRVQVRPRSQKENEQGAMDWAWGEATLFDFTPDDSSLEGARRWLREQDQPAYLLLLEGARAAALLLGEAGVYEMRSREGGHYMTRIQASSAAPDAAPLSKSLAPYRSISEPQDRLVDHHLRLHRPLEPRWHRIIERLARTRTLREVFGPDGQKWARRWQGEAA